MPDLTDEQKSELPKNVITRALGMQDQVVVDLQHDDPRAGDVYVLCSDGLSGMVTDDDIEQIVTGAPDIREACRKLIQRANERGGEDNITAVLIKIEEHRSRVGRRARARTAPPRRRERAADGAGDGAEPRDRAATPVSGQHGAEPATRDRSARSWADPSLTVP